MTTIHLHNLDIVTLDEQGTIHRQADLVIADGWITHLGQAPDTLQADEIIDASARVALPGLVNAHCHSPMTLLRGWAEDMYFPEWLPKVWRAENQLTTPDIYWGAALAACEMIRTGTIAFNDMYFFMDRVAEVVSESGMKAALTWGFFDPGDGTSVGPALEQTIEWVKATHARGSSRIKTYLGPHSPYTCSQTTLERVVKIAHDLGQGIHLHLSESQEQVDQSLERYGLRPVQHLDSIGVFEAPGGCVAAHTIYVDGQDIEILAEKGVHVPHCPITYMKLAMPFFSLKANLQAGVKMCLGTDGPASNADMDMFAIMRQTALTQKLLQIDPTMMPGDTVLRLATQAGARALGFADSGVLKVGAPADLILVNLDAPHLRPVHNLIANLVHSAKGSDVTDVMVDGQWLMRNRELKTLDEDRILYEVETRARALVERVKQ